MLLFAWGLADPGPDMNITFDPMLVGSAVLPLLSYNQPPPQSKFAGLDTFEFRVNNVNDFHCIII